ncbi:MAG: PIN domain-containing protein [Chloroflexi bacterium]|nr:PIN domain-containing protein [Chloroflexota bacterium]
MPAAQGTASGAPSNGPAPAPVVVDASVWAAFFLVADTTHAASYAWLDRHTAAGGLVVSPSILLTEVTAAISRRLGPPTGSMAALRAASTVGRLAQARIVPMDEALMSEATGVAARFGLRGADSIYIAAARQLGIPLLTWDNEQLTRATGIITAFHP